MNRQLPERETRLFKGAHALEVSTQPAVWAQRVPPFGEIPISQVTGSVSCAQLMPMQSKTMATGMEQQGVFEAERL